MLGVGSWNDTQGCRRSGVGDLGCDTDIDILDMRAVNCCTSPRPALTSSISFAILDSLTAPSSFPRQADSASFANSSRSACYHLYIILLLIQCRLDLWMKTSENRPQHQIVRQPWHFTRHLLHLRHVIARFFAWAPRASKQCLISKENVQR